MIEGPLIPEAILPLASCKAVGGQAKDAVYVAAALTAAATSLRILDDLEDQDRPERLWKQVGPARTWNYASAIESLSFIILSQSPLAPETFHQINGTFADTFLHITYGQDRDLSGNPQTTEDYWLTMEQKIAWGYAAGCAAGAIVGTDRKDLIEACGDFGFHLGLTIQLVNDMESIWHPDGVTDLMQGKITLPLIYGLTENHANRDELAALVETNQIAAHGERIKEILDTIDARSFMIWAALKERDQALEALTICPDPEGKEALEAYITGLFGDIEPLLPLEST